MCQFCPKHVVGPSLPPFRLFYNPVDSDFDGSPLIDEEAHTLEALVPGRGSLAKHGYPLLAAADVAGHELLAVVSLFILYLIALDHIFYGQLGIDCGEESLSMDLVGRGSFLLHGHPLLAATDVAG